MPVLPHTLYPVIVIHHHVFSRSFAASLQPLLAAVIVVSNGAGVRISIQKHTSLTKADGTFDYEEAIRKTERTVQYADSYLNVSPYII